MTGSVGDQAPRDAAQPAGPEPRQSTVLPAKPTRKRRLITPVVLGLAAVGAAGLAMHGILLRQANVSALKSSAEDAAIPSVSVITPTPATANRPLIVPGDVNAWYEAPIYGQVSGYVVKWYKDYGDPVKAGDLLATIDAPTLDQDYRQAEADLNVALADEKLAEITAKRWERLVATTAVSQQNSDEKTYGYKATTARRLAAQSRVNSLKALLDFKQLLAPFDGVVTARETDVGAFVKANGIGNQVEMFRVADVHMMRVFVKVPQIYAAAISAGMQASLLIPQFPNREFKAKVATTARAINIESRTLLVELWAPNPTGELMPGTYAEVHFQLPPDPSALTVPTTALIFQQHGLQIATVDASDRIELHEVKVGRDLGPNVTVVSGLKPTDRVVAAPPAAAYAGERVAVVTSPTQREGLETVKAGHSGASGPVTPPQAKARHS